MGLAKLCCLLLLSISTVSALALTNLTSWAFFRAAVVRDTLYLNGGEAWEGQNSVLKNENEAFIYTLNFSKPFDTAKANLTPLFGKIPLADTKLAPNYYYGSMLANYDELYFFGGQISQTDSYQQSFLPNSTYMGGYQLYNENPNVSPWAPGLFPQNTGNVSLYISNGAFTSAPSENLGFYFSGIRTTDGNPLWYEQFDSDPITAVKSMITIEMSTPTQGTWTTANLTSTVTPRADAQLIWVPTSTRGILVAIGGVMYPDEVAGEATDPQNTQSNADSPGFMKTVAIYDVASANWYTQATSGSTSDGYPPQLADFCSVLAVAKDNSSYNIYIYGGYDGNSGNLPYDDVWVLSLPSFFWFKAYPGSIEHGRSGHYCATPYPNLMFSVGGQHGGPPNALAGSNISFPGIIQVFNMSSLQWQDSYTPELTEKEYEYKVPSLIYDVISGTADGGATKTAAWSDANLGALFGVHYPKPTRTYYPYALAPTPTSSPVSRKHSWLIPVIVVVATVIAISIIASLVFIFCKRRKSRNNKVTSGDVDTSSFSDNHSRVGSWINGVPKDTTSVATTELDDPNPSQSALRGYFEVTGEPKPDSPNSPGMRSMYSRDSQNQRNSASDRHASVEAGGEERYELHTRDWQIPVEMATPYHFQEHPTYPRSIDYAFAGSSQSQSHSHRGVPSPHVYPLQPDSGLPPPSPPSARTSPTASPPTQSPELEDGVEHRPSHKRNVSSLSQLPSPEAHVTPLAVEETSPQRPLLSSTAYTDFGPDGQARSPSVIMRKAVPDRRYEDGDD